MDEFDDMLDWIIEEVCHARPYNDFLDCYNSEINHPGYMGWIRSVKMSQATHDAICEQLQIKPILEMNGLTVIVSDTLPDNVYKFD